MSVEMAFAIGSIEPAEKWRNPEKSAPLCQQNPWKIWSSNIIYFNNLIRLTAIVFLPNPNANENSDSNEKENAYWVP